MNIEFPTKYDVSAPVDTEPKKGKNQLKREANQKPLAHRPDESARPGDPLAAWEIDVLRQMYPGGWRLSVLPAKKESHPFAHMNRREFRRTVQGKSQPSNRKLTEGRARHNAKRYGALIHPNNKSVPVMLKKAGIAIKRACNYIASLVK